MSGASVDDINWNKVHAAFVNKPATTEEPQTKKGPKKGDRYFAVGKK